MPARKRTATKATPEKRRWEDKFLGALASSGLVHQSCEEAGIAVTTAYRRRDSCEGFAARWEAALEKSIEHLEGIARRRAEDSSDTLLIFMLKSLRPNVYRDNMKVEHTGANGAPIITEIVMHYAPDQPAETE